MFRSFSFSAFDIGAKHSWLEFGFRLAEGWIQGFWRRMCFCVTFLEFSLAKWLLLAVGQFFGNQDYHEDHFGPFNSVGRLCLDMCRVWVAYMVRDVILNFLNFL